LPFGTSPSVRSLRTHTRLHTGSSRSNERKQHRENAERQRTRGQQHKKQRTNRYVKRNEIERDAKKRRCACDKQPWNKRRSVCDDMPWKQPKKRRSVCDKQPWNGRE
jgi:hypothetical protein